MLPNEMDSNQRFEQLERKYAPVLGFLAEQQVQLQNLNVQDEKLLIRATVYWEDLKRSHRVNPRPHFSKYHQTCTVREGDALPWTTERIYGDRSPSERISEANRDQPSDPDEIEPGQVLSIPALQ